VCHGRDRRSLEPYGVVAPFVRAAAWGAIFLGSLSFVTMIVCQAVGVYGPTPALAAVWAGAWVFGTSLRAAAVFLRSAPVVVPFVPEPRP
jgi:hypothetical protein